MTIVNWVAASVVQRRLWKHLELSPGRTISWASSGWYRPSEAALPITLVNEITF